MGLEKSCVRYAMEDGFETYYIKDLLSYLHSCVCADVLHFELVGQC